jgi:hypothetical protein
MDYDMGSTSHNGHNVSQRLLFRLQSEHSDFSSVIRCARRGLCARSLTIAAMLALLVLGVRAGDKKVDVSKVHGRIQYVKSFPDYKVQAVKSFPDLRVEIVESFPNSPGKWQIVDSFPGYKIQMVESFPDFTVQFVNSFPGPSKQLEGE